MVRKWEMEDKGQGNQSASEVHLYLPALLKITIKYRVGNCVGELKKFFLLALHKFARGRGRESPSLCGRSNFGSGNTWLVLIDASQNE